MCHYYCRVMSERKIAKVIYIIADSHSGSTLFDMVCGTIPGVFSLGEITHFSWELYKDQNENTSSTAGRCSCLQKFNACAAWGKILAVLNEKVGYDVYEDPYRFSLGFASPLELHALFLGIARRMIASKFLYSAGSRLVSARYPTSAANSWLLFDTISEVCGVTHVVDSSKIIVRLNMLHRMRPSDIRVVVLVRDVRGIANSAQSRSQDPIAAARQWYWFYERAFRTLRNAKANWLLVKYEDVCKDPAKERRRVAEFAGIDGVQGDCRIDTREHHLVAGNRIRYKGKLEIKEKDWRKHLSDDLEERILKITARLFREYPTLEPSG